MMLLRDAQDFIDTLGITENSYCGKMPDKQKKAIGVYHLKPSHDSGTALGGKQNRSYETKGISFLVHWNESPSESEDSAIRFQEALSGCRDVTINGHEIKFINISYDEPIPVGTDDDGIYEYVIECVFYLRKGNEE